MHTAALPRRMAAGAVNPGSHAGAWEPELFCRSPIVIPIYDRSHAPALMVIHKWLKPVIPAWTAGIQSQGGESAGWCVHLIEHLHNDELPSMALDSCIPAGMTAFSARRDLCITNDVRRSVGTIAIFISL